MTDKTVTELETATPLTGAEFVPLTQEGESKKVRLQEMADKMSNLGTTQNWAVPFRGALIALTSDNTGITFPIAVPWQQSIYDTDGFWSVGNPSRMTVPAGVTKVRLLAGINTENVANTGSLIVSLLKNGVGLEYNGVIYTRNNSSGFSNNASMSISPVVEVEEGDYFEVRVNCNISGVEDIIVDGSTFFAIEVVETSDSEARPFELSRFIGGLPSAASLIDQQVLSRKAFLATDGGLSQFYANTAPSADTAFDVQKNGVSIGTLTFLTSTNEGSLSLTATEFEVGDRLGLISPDPVNAISDISINYRMSLV